MASRSATKPVFGETAGDGAGGNKKVLSKGQLKKAAKRKEWEAKMKRVEESLMLKQFRGLKGLKQGMEGALPEGSSDPAVRPAKQPEKAKVVKSNAQKTAIAATEKQHFQLVLQHPQFQAKPSETIKEHLLNVLAMAQKEEGVGAGGGGKETKQGKEKVKRNGSAKRRKGRHR